MNKREIVNKLKADHKALITLINSQYASDAKIALEAKYFYVAGLLEWIQQEGKV